MFEVPLVLEQVIMLLCLLVVAPLQIVVILGNNTIGDSNHLPYNSQYQILTSKLRKRYNLKRGKLDIMRRLR